MGWTSMYDGSQIKEEEMTEWLDDTIEAIRDGHPPRHILEIGTGTGMILFNLAKEFESYIGLEPAETATNFVTKMIKTIPGLANKTQIRLGTAADLPLLPRLKSPTTVVVNSSSPVLPISRILHKGSGGPGPAPRCAAVILRRREVLRIVRPVSC